MWLWKIINVGKLKNLFFYYNFLFLSTNIFVKIKVGDEKMGLIEKHLLKYPLMEVADKIKLLMQSIMGPGHLANDKERIMNNLINEYEICKEYL